MNTITVTGRLTHDPDRRTVTVGDDERSVTTLPLALDDHRPLDLTLRPVGPAGGQADARPDGG